MIIVFKSAVDRNRVDEIVRIANIEPHKIILLGKQFHLILLETKNDIFALKSKFSEISDIICGDKEYKFVDKVFKNERFVRINNNVITPEDFLVIAGPCSVESEEQIHHIASKVAGIGANILRGGTFKARTSPYRFQGLGEVGLKFLSSAASQHNLLSVTEVLDTRDVELASRYVDILQIGTRNMSNFSLIREAAKSGKPLILKRGFSATYHEFLLAAEYAYLEGNPNIILCERGIKTFENYTRNTLDLAAVPVLQHLTHLPVIVDPSHGTGWRYLVEPLSKAALAVGASGLMLEVHHDPDSALSDAKQTIGIDAFRQLMGSLRTLGKALGRNISYEKNSNC